MKIMLIHGYANNTLRKMLKNDGYVRLYQVEFDEYITTIATDSPINSPEDYIEIIHNSVDYLATLSTKTALFTELYEPPAKLKLDNGKTFDFVGGIWGYNQTGKVKYQYA